MSILKLIWINFILNCAEKIEKSHEMQTSNEEVKHFNTCAAKAPSAMRILRSSSNHKSELFEQCLQIVMGI